MNRVVSLLFVVSGLLSLRSAVSINEVGKLLMNMQPVLFTVTPECVKKTTKTGKFIVDTDLKKFFPSESCRISNLESDLPRVILNDDKETKYGEDDIKPVGFDLEFRALFLLQLPNILSYMALDPEEAHWLFTNPLSGCDIFIATARDPARRNLPLVVHANYDLKNSPSEAVENLEWKGNKVDQILSRDTPGNYVLRARIYASPEKTVPQNYDQYIDNYKAAHPGVIMERYNVPPVHQFYGHYETVWKFFLKREDNGLITDIDIPV